MIIAQIQSYFKEEYQTKYFVSVFGRQKYLLNYILTRSPFMAIFSVPSIGTTAEVSQLLPQPP